MKKIKKLIALTLIGSSMLMVAPVASHAEWRADGYGWWYTEGNSYATGWRQINGLWYFFYADGYMAHDTVIEGYYVNSNGVYEPDSSAQGGYGSALQSGYYRVGTDIDPGEYLLIPGSDYGYYECTSDTSGTLDSIKYNGVLIGYEPVYITVYSGECLKIDNVNIYKASEAPSIKPSNNVYNDGQYKVGRDIPAGTYVVTDLGNGTVEVNSNSRHNSSTSRLFESLYGYSLTITLEDGEYVQLTGAQIIA